MKQIAALEVSIFDTFPDRKQIQSNLDKLRPLLREVLKEDEELREQVNALQDKLNEDGDTYAKLDKVQEVISK